MTYYVYGEIYLKHTEWVDEYLSNINSFIERHKGIVLSRSLNMEKVEGDREIPSNVILVEFSNRKAALNFFSDPAYQSLRKLRLEGATSEFTLFPSEDLAILGIGNISGT